MDVLLDLIDPKWWLTMFGAFATIGVLAIVFAETGLLFGFFLPGDSLLVAAGIFAVPAAAAGLGITPLSLPVLLVAAPLCAIAGAQLGHFLGAKFGRRLFDKPDSRLFKQEHVQKAEYYFEKFGPAKAVVLARFMPIVRTFLNPVAGVLGMDRRRFFLWNVVGGIAWIESMLLFGYFVGSAVEDIDKYILPGVAVIVLISVMPIVIEVIKNRRSGGVEPLGGKHHRSADLPVAAPAGPAPDVVDPFDLYISQMASGDPSRTGQPGSSFPGASFPGAAPSGGPFHGAAQPGSPYPEPGRPGVPFPGAAQPGNPYPGSGLPGGSYPGTGHPSASHPETAYPGESYPGASDHGAAPRSGGAYSGNAYPGYSQPGYSQPGYSQPGDPYPNPAQPGTGSYPGSEPVPQQPAASPDWQAWQAWQGPDSNR